jgi:hypothetical protein
MYSVVNEVTTEAFCGATTKTFEGDQQDTSGVFIMSTSDCLIGAISPFLKDLSRGVSCIIHNHRDYKLPALVTLTLYIIDDIELTLLIQV